MGPFGPTPDAPEGVRRVLDIVAIGIERAVAQLGAPQQAEFWRTLQSYAGAERQKRGRSAHLVAAPHTEEAVRRALETADGDIATNLADLNAGGRQRFWALLDDLCRRQVEANRQGPPGLRREAGS